MCYLFPGIVIASLFFFYFPKILAETAKPDWILIRKPPECRPLLSVAPSTAYPVDRPYLLENVGPGKQLRFSDGSSYLVSPENQEEASLWISPFPLDIQAGKDPAYPYTLYNSNTQTAVSVKKQ